MEEKYNPTKELMEKLEKGIRECMDGEKFRTYLKTQSMFHNYSVNNAFLIMMQKPNATRVAGFQTWKKLERSVLRGEKGISILAPSPYRYEKEVNKLDPKTKKPILDANNNILKEKITLEGLGFRKVTVFDVSQTAGKELPSICNELKGESLNSKNIIKAIEKISDVPVRYEDIQGGAKGYYSRKNNVIALKEGMSMDQTVKTLIHEYAHSQLHNKPESILMDRSTQEVQAESVAFIVSNKFGVDTSQYSFEYLASWSGNKELSQLKESLDIIQKTSDKIITQIEKELSKEIVTEVKLEKEVNENNQKQIVPETSIQNKENVKETVKDEIVKLYSKEFPAIKYISDQTAKDIKELNDTRDKPYSIKGIKGNYKILGNKLDQGDASINELFNKHDRIVSDLKNASLELKNVKARENVAELSKAQEIAI